MSTTAPRKRSNEEISRLADEIYANKIAPLLGPDDKGKFIAISIDTAAYEFDEDDLAATDRLAEREPGATMFLGRVGYRAAFRI